MDLNISFSTIIKLLILLVGGILLNALLQRYIRIPKKIESTRAQTYIIVLKNFVSFAVYGITLYLLLSTIQINPTPLFASAGIFGIIIGLGLRPLIEDFFTGLFMLSEDILRVGDYVMIGDSEGTIEFLCLRTLRLRDKYGAIHIIPNREIKKIINYSKKLSRVIVDIQVKNSQSIDNAITLLEKSLDKLKKDKKVGQLILEKSHVEGIELITPGNITLRTVILTKSQERFQIARSFRSIAVSEFQKNNVLLA